MKYITDPFERFFRLETSSSILLLFFAIVALAVANTPLSDLYHQVLHYDITLGIADGTVSKPIILWINDGLMAVFFFVIGLEIKREVMVGELSDFRKATLPIFAAVGGMVVPVVVFLLLNNNTETREGWAIPMATDIAFTLGILKLLGNRVPYGLKVFLTAFAIADDLGAIIIIALFYGSAFKWNLLIIALALIVALIILCKLNLYSKYFFFLVGLAVWFLFLKSGIHATVAGVLMAFTIPIKRQINIKTFKENITEALAIFIRSYQTRKKIILSKQEMGAINTIEQSSQLIQSPLQYLENRLHGWVVYVIMPVFALANAGVTFVDQDFTHLNLSLAIMLGLVIGKSAGIFIFSWLAIRSGISGKIEQVGFTGILGAGFLGGLGFTMSLFITNLAFSDQVLIDTSKIGILAGSILAGLSGYLILRYVLPQKASPPES